MNNGSPIGGGADPILHTLLYLRGNFLRSSHQVFRDMAHGRNISLVGIQGNILAKGRHRAFRSTLVHTLRANRVRASIGVVPLFGIFWRVNF